MERVPWVTRAPDRTGSAEIRAGRLIVSLVRAALSFGLAPQISGNCMVTRSRCMQPIDYLVIAIFFLLVAVIGWVAIRRIAGSKDYFVAGGRIPWWLGGISHHVSGHSGVV